MNIYSLPPFITSILFLLFGIFVYFRNRKVFINFIFFLLCFVTFWWQFSWFILFNTRSETLANYLVKVGYMGIIFIPIFFFHFFVLFLKEVVKKIDEYLLYLSYFLAVIFEFFLIRTNLFISGFYKYFWGFYPKAGILHPFYLLLLTTLAIRGLYFTIASLQRKKFTKTRHLQVKYLLLALIIYIFAATDFLVNYGVEFYPFGFIFALIFIGILAFAITKFHLFGIRVILTELLVGTIGIILFLQIIFAQNLQWRISSFSVFLLFLIFAYYLLKSVHEEERRREEAERLAQKERELKNEAEKLAKEWQMLAQSKDQFIISIQHHFRTPLSIFKGYLSNILEGIWGPVPPEILNKLNNVLFSANDLTRLIESLLEVQQFKLGKGFLLISKEDISETLKETIEELKPEIERRKLSLNLNIFPLIFEFDKKRIKEVFFNILNNAIKYSFRQGKITISLYQEKDSPLPIRISFQDEGKGMEKEEIETLKKGELFFRSKESSSFDATGKGIGLAISFEFIKAHGGQIDFYSQGKNKGTTVTVLLPLSPPKENAYYLSQAGILTRK